MIRSLLLFIFVQISVLAFAQDIRHLKLNSQHLESVRDVWIFLPPQYNEENQYPVLYMHDGQNLYWDTLAFASTWDMENNLVALQRENIDLIIIAIANGGEKRMEELSTFTNSKYSSGKGSNYLAFIVEELMPVINNNYPVDKDKVGIMGSSLGGLISLQAMAEYPHVFNRGGIFSPALWFNPETMDKSYLATIHPDSRIYMISGGKEVMGDIDFPKDQKKTEQLLSAIISPDKLHSQIHPDGEHKEWYWAREFLAAVRFMFKN